MVSSFVFIILLAIVYGYVTDDSQFTSTPSAIQQIWSGRCRLACRQGPNSGPNSIRGLLQAHRVDNSHAGPSSACICEACPCALIENVYRTCGPVVRLYSDIIEIVSNLVYDVMTMISDTWTYIGSLFRCRASCRHDAQTPSQVPFSFKEDIQENESIEKAKQEIKSEASSAVSTNSEIYTKNSVPTLEGPSKKKTEDPPKLDMSCSKCRMKGNICMPNCPRQKKIKAKQS